MNESKNISDYDIITTYAEGDSVEENFNSRTQKIYGSEWEVHDELNPCDVMERDYSFIAERIFDKESLEAYKKNRGDVVENLTSKFLSRLIPEVTI